MKWTYGKIQEYVRRVRRYTLKRGCRKCKKLAPTLELLGFPGITSLARNGYGLDRIKGDIRERGLYCRSCSRGYAKEASTKLMKGWGEVVVVEEVVAPAPTEDKRLWTDERKFEYCMAGNKHGGHSYEEMAKDCWEEGPLLDEALEILREPL